MLLRCTLWELVGDGDDKKFQPAARMLLRCTRRGGARDGAGQGFNQQHECYCVVPTDLAEKWLAVRVSTSSTDATALYPYTSAPLAFSRLFQPAAQMLLRCTVDGLRGFLADLLVSTSSADAAALYRSAWWAPRRV